MTTQSIPAHLYRSQGLEATVHYACRYCQAPGVWSDKPEVKAGWKGCYVEPGDELVGQSVGPMCPNCSADRAPGLLNRLGEIWRKHFVAE